MNNLKDYTRLINKLLKGTNYTALDFYKALLCNTYLKQEDNLKGFKSEEKLMYEKQFEEDLKGMYSFASEYLESHKDILSLINQVDEKDNNKVLFYASSMIEDKKLTFDDLLYKLIDVQGAGEIIVDVNMSSASFLNTVNSSVINEGYVLKELYGIVHSKEEYYLRRIEARLFYYYDDCNIYLDEGRNLTKEYPIQYAYIHPFTTEYEYKYGTEYDYVKDILDTECGKKILVFMPIDAINQEELEVRKKLLNTQMVESIIFLPCYYKGRKMMLLIMDAVFKHDKVHLPKYLETYLHHIESIHLDELDIVSIIHSYKHSYYQCDYKFLLNLIDEIFDLKAKKIKQPVTKL